MAVVSFLDETKAGYQTWHGRNSHLGRPECQKRLESHVASDVSHHATHTFFRSGKTIKGHI